MQKRPHQQTTTPVSVRRRRVSRLLLCALLVCALARAELPQASLTLQQLTDQRLMLTAELDQFRETLALVHPGDTPPEQSPNSAVRTLAVGAVALKQRLIEVTEQEVTLLQQQILTAKDKIRAEQTLRRDYEAALETTAPTPTADVIDDPATADAAATARVDEAGSVERLHALLDSYYQELEESAQILPTPEEIAQREQALHDSRTLEKTLYSADQVRLNGSEASTALAHISERLVDPRIPESRRDTAPICNIKTRLLDTLVGAENRSLKPVGKNHYIVKVRLQPGDTTISVLSDQWQVQLPETAGAQDFVITLYRPVQGAPELHVFAVDDLLAVTNPHLPAWLPDELGLKTRAG